jgi:hypothetical protein
MEMCRFVMSDWLVMVVMIAQTSSTEYSQSSAVKARLRVPKFPRDLDPDLVRAN